MSQILGTEGNDRLVGSTLSDSIVGGAGDDTLIAGAAGDTLDGGDGDDLFSNEVFSNVTLLGGEGNDTYVVEVDDQAAGDITRVYLEDVNRFLAPNDDTDILDLSAVADDIKDIRFSGANDLYIRVYDDAGNNLLYVQVDRQIIGDEDFGDVLWGIETLRIDGTDYDLTIHDGFRLNSVLVHGAGDSDDTITGIRAYEDLTGLDGDDLITSGGIHSNLYGGAGNDTLVSSFEGDRLNGGDGDDLLIFEADEAASFLVSEGNDTVSAAWSDASASTVRSLYVYDSYDAAAEGMTLLDLSSLPAIGDLTAESSGDNGVTISLRDANGAEIATIAIDRQLRDPEAAVIDRLVVGEIAYDLSLAATVSEMQGLFNFSTSGAADTVLGTADGDLIFGAGGDDLVRGGSGQDNIMGGSGSDRLFGQEGDDTLLGGDGSDYLIGASGADYVYGNVGDDTIWAGAGDTSGDILIGGDGADIIGGGEGDDLLVGGELGLVIAVGIDRLMGGAGDDTIVGGSWADGRGTQKGVFEPGEQVSSMYWYEGGKELWGGSGDDLLYGVAVADIIGGGAGNDTIHADAGHDLVYGGRDDGQDSVSGGDGDDTVLGGAGNDSLSGDGGIDVIFNGQGNDTVSGGEGDDILWGGPGDDLISGDEGADVFAFTQTSGNDTIADFDLTTDSLDLREAGISDLGAVSQEASFDGFEGLLISLSDSSSVFLLGMSTDQLDSILILA